MPNPYYIPRHHTTQDLANLGLQLYGLKQRGDIATAQQALTAKELGLRGETVQLERQRQLKEYGTPAFEGDVYSPPTAAIPGLKEREMAVHERQIGATEAQTKLAEQKLNPREKNWGLGDYTMFGARLRQVGFEPDKLEFMKELKATAMDNNINRGAFAENLKVSWDQGGKNRFLEDLQKNVDDTLKKNPNADVRKQLGLIDTLQKVETKDVIPTFFPDIAQHDVMEAKKSMPTIQQVMGAKATEEGMTAKQMGTLIHPPPEAKGTWSEPYDLQGAKVQKNSLTGEVRTAVTKLPGETEASFKTGKLKEVWDRLDDQSKLKVLGALPPDKELTEKNILDVYGNIFTDAETKKALQPIVEEITKRAAAKNIPPGKKTNMLPEGAKQIGTLNGKPVYETADGKRFVSD